MARSVGLIRPGHRPCKTYDASFRSRAQPASHRPATGRRPRYSLMQPSSGGLDVIAQRFGLALHLAEPMLHDIADRYDANQSLLIDDRNVAELARGHLLH